MHGAKGLEWDMVVLPALNKPPPPAQSPLLYWLPLSTQDGAEQVLLAPRRSSEHAQDPPLVSLIRNEQQQRATFENQRLLYVAATRARERLLLSAQLDAANPDFRPLKGSLLSELWPTTAQGFLASFEVNSRAGAAPVTPASILPDQTLHRVAAGWQPEVSQEHHWVPTLARAQPIPEIEYDWAGRVARTTGTVLHRLLEHVGNVGIEQLDQATRRLLLDRVPGLLNNLGITGEALEASAAIVRQALIDTLDSQTGQWLLSGQHQESACELAVSGIIHGQLVNLVVDRTFIDAHGKRWIIDYKSGYHAGGDPAGFFQQEAMRYSTQLDRYRRLLAALGPQPIQCALYLPRHTHLEVLSALSLEVP